MDVLASSCAGLASLQVASLHRCGRSSGTPACPPAPRGVPSLALCRNSQSRQLLQAGRGLGACGALSGGTPSLLGPLSQTARRPKVLPRSDGRGRVSLSPRAASLPPSSTTTTSASGPNLVQSTAPGGGAGAARKKAEVRQVALVDPLIAKKMAEDDVKRRKVAAGRQRLREIEAINGGWAAVGLCAGIVREGLTGQGIILQIAGYLDMLTDALAKMAN